MARDEATRMARAKRGQKRYSAEEWRERRASERVYAPGRAADARTRALLVYPSPYAVGMSSLGFQQIYRLWNEVEDAGCDRAFVPASGDAPLRGLETGRPPGGFDLVGVSLSWELELGGVVRALALGGMNPRAAERRREDPPVVLGGPLTFSNPLPAYPLVDVVVLGEAEEAAPALLRARAAADGKEAFLEAVRGLPGVVVPALDGPVLPALARAPEAALPARSAIVARDTELRRMFLVEVSRGCPRRCTYCVMRRPDAECTHLAGGGMRAVAAERVLAAIPADATRAGLVGAAVTDHPELRSILRKLAEAGIGIGVSSLRADRLDDELAALLRVGGLRTLTTAADGASERLRRLVLRGTAVRHLVRAAELVRDHGFAELKLYVMLGLPTETDEDVDELAALARELGAIARVSLSVSPFVAKRNTPLATAPFAGVRVVEGRLARLRRALAGRVVLRPTSARWAWVEQALASAGPEGGEAAVGAVREGGTYAAWRRALRA